MNNKSYPVRKPKAHYPKNPTRYKKELQYLRGYLQNIDMCGKLHLQNMCPRVNHKSIPLLPNKLIEPRKRICIIFKITHRIASIAAY